MAFDSVRTLRLNGTAATLDDSIRVKDIGGEGNDAMSGNFY